MPRYLPIPPDVTFMNIFTKKPQMVKKTEEGAEEPSTISFREFYLNVLSNDPRLTTVKGARALYKFDQAYEEAAGGDKVMVLDEDVWTLWKDMATTPKYQTQGAMGPQTHEGFFGYRGVGVMQLLPFVDAIEAASDKKPEKPAPAPSAPALEAPVGDAQADFKSASAAS